MKPVERTYIVSGIGRPGQLKRITVRELATSTTPRKPTHEKKHK